MLKEYNLVRKEIMTTILVIGSILVLPTLMSSLVRIYYTGWHYVYLPQILFALTVIALLFFRRFLPLSVQLHTLSIIFLIVGLLGNYRFSLSSGSQFYFLPILIVSLLSSRKVAVVYIVISLMFYYLLAFFHSQGLVGMDIDFNDYNQKLGVWISRSISISYVMLVAVYGLSKSRLFFMKYLADLEKKTEELQFTQFNLSRAQQIAHIGSWQLDIEKKTLYWSDEVYRIFGLEPKEINADYEIFLEFVHPEDRDSVNKAYTESVINKKPYEITHRIVLKDGTIKIVNERCETIYDKDGRALQSIGTVHDITEKRRIEEMMIQNEKMLSLGGMAAGMAHEIKNPLSGIIQTAGVISNRIGLKSGVQANIKAAEDYGISMDAISNYMDTREIPKMLALIEESVKRITSVIENMLSFSRKSEGVRSLMEVPEILDKTLSIAATDYNKEEGFYFQKISIKKEYSNSLSPVSCEVTQIQQVLLNILRNAVQAMIKAETVNPMLIIRASLESDNDFVVIEVEDNGPGISEEVRKRIFEPFFTTKKEGQGTGLGLSISYYIITQNHSGEMYVESQLGRGCKFVIKLPVTSV